MKYKATLKTKYSDFLSKGEKEVKMFEKWAEKRKDLICEMGIYKGNDFSIFTAIHIEEDRAVPFELIANSKSYKAETFEDLIELLVEQKLIKDLNKFIFVKKR